MQIPVKPDVTPEGAGRIGVQIFSNVFIDHVKANSPTEALQIAGAEFNRLSGVVLGGLQKVWRERGWAMPAKGVEGAPLGDPNPSGGLDPKGYVLYVFWK